MSSIKNYTKQGGEVTIIGGELTIKKGAKLIFEKDSSIEGKLIENQTESTATTIASLKEDFNLLLEKLKASGVMEKDEIE